MNKNFNELKIPANALYLVLHMLLVVLHNPPLHRMVLLWNKSIRRQVCVIRIIFIRVVSTRCCRVIFVSSSINN